MSEKLDEQENNEKTKYDWCFILNQKKILFHEWWSLMIELPKKSFHNTVPGSATYECQLKAQMEQNTLQNKREKRFCYTQFTLTD